MFGIDFPCVTLHVGAAPILGWSAQLRVATSGAHWKDIWGLLVLASLLAFLPSVWGLLVSPQGYDDEWQVFWAGARPTSLVQAGLSGRLAWEGCVGDLPGCVTFSSGLQIGSSKCPFWSSRQALWHGTVKYVIWGTFVPCPSVICTETSEWTFICVASTATSPIMVFVHHFTCIPCKTWWDTKLVEVISLNKTLCPNYFKFPH